MDPLIATMDQSSLGNKNKKISSGPNTKDQSSKLLHKTDQDTSIPVILSPSSVLSPSSFECDEFSLKNNRYSEENHRRKTNHRGEHDDQSSRDLQKAPNNDDDDYDDNKDVVVVKELKNHDTNISKKIETLSLKSSGTSGTELNNVNQSKRCGSKESEGTSSPSQTIPSPPPPHPIAPNRTNTTYTTATTTTPTSCTDIITKNRDLSKACHHQPPSSSPTSAFPQERNSQSVVASNGGGVGNYLAGGRTPSMQQRRQPPIIKAQSLDFACDDETAEQVLSHLQNNHNFFQNNHHHHRNYLHNQHLHHFNHFSHHSSSSSGRKQKTINKGCSLDNQPAEEEEALRSTGIIGTPTTEDVDADVDEDDDEELIIKRAPTLTANSLRSHTVDGDAPSSLQRPLGSFDSASSTGDTTDSSQQTDAVRLSSPQPRQHNLAKGILPKVQSLESRPIYPNVPYSPYASPYGSPRSNRRRTPLRESRRISIEQSGSFLQLNQYKLMDQIGQGSYGLVKLAYSEEDSTHYAMKILSKRRLLRKAGLMSRGPKKTTSPLDRVYREIAVLKKLDHPNVVKLIEVLDDPLEDSLYLVFELVKQGEVLCIPTDKPLTEERTWSVFRDAVQGLEYLHYQRIIHADIKPGNLLLTECGHVKIADLGVCNEFLGEDATMNNGSTAGTPAFRAPETLFPGQHLYSGKAADIWALGATLYSLVYGNVPFVATSVPLLYEKIKNETLTIPEKPVLSEELVDLIRKMLTKDPAKRITLPQIKEHPWVTANGVHILPSEDDNCRLVQVSEEDINSVVKSIPKLDTLILIKTMLKNHSFLNPFSRGISGRAPQRGGSRLERFTRAGRSNSAPGAYHSPIDRQLSGDCILPALSEHGVSSSSDIPEDS